MPKFACANCGGLSGRAGAEAASVAALKLQRGSSARGSLFWLCVVGEGGGGGLMGDRFCLGAKRGAVCDDGGGFAAALGLDMDDEREEARARAAQCRRPRRRLLRRVREEDEGHSSTRTEEEQGGERHGRARRGLLTRCVLRVGWAKGWDMAIVLQRGAPVTG